MLAPTASRRSIFQYIHTFFALWTRYAVKVVPTEVRIQVKAYFNSLDLSELAPLTRIIRPKPIATELDLDIIIQATYDDRTLFRTMRMKVQFTYVNLVSATTTERPGSIIESSSYKNSNDGMEWGDKEFFVIPNPENPERPNLAIIVRIRLHKAHRKDEKHYKYYFILLEPNGTRASCLGTCLLYMALQDGVFQDVTTIEEIFRPARIPTRIHKLAMKPEVLTQPVLRAEVINDDTGLVTISPTRALRAATHSTQLKTISMRKGLYYLMSLYCFRRGAAGRLNKEVSETERTGMMGQEPGSTIYGRAYESRLYQFDLGAIYRGREQDEQNLGITKEVASMSARRDERAPTSLTVGQRGELLNEPELVALRADIAKVGRRIVILNKTNRRAGPSPNHDGMASLHDLVGRRSYLFTDHASIVNRETKARVSIQRKAFFDDASRRELTGEAPPSVPPMATARAALVPAAMNVTAPPPSRSASDGKENGASSRLLLNLPPLDPFAKLVDIVYEYAEDDLTGHVSASVNALLCMPERPFKACYTGESPDAKGCCPVCHAKCVAKEMSRGASMPGSHIHDCVAKAQQQHVQEYVEANWEQQKCCWGDCTRYGYEFHGRPAFVDHVQRHIDSFHRHLNSTTQTYCRWELEDGNECGAEDAEDWRAHFGQVHSLNVNKKVKVKFCAICCDWTVDETGDGLLWDGHLNEHYEELFEPFSDRVEDAVDLTPIDVSFVDQCVEFEQGSGFSGLQPEFHGHVHKGVALAPMYCPWCVFDQTLTLEARMQQYTQLFVAHIKSHDNRLIMDDSVENQCPVPSCGVHKFSGHDLRYHMVAFHRIPLCGSSRVVAVRRLNLPKLDLDPALAPVVDLAHLHDTDDDDQPAPTRKAKAAESYADAAERRRRERETIPKIRAFCCGCSTEKADIRLHLEGTKPTSRCRVKNQYEVVGENGRSGTRLAWDFSETPAVAAGSSSKQGRQHRCGKCRHTFVHIRDHLAEPNFNCPTTKFQIRDPNVPRSTYGTTYNIQEWLAENVILICLFSPRLTIHRTEQRRAHRRRNGPRQ
ncbi:hypothetical protein DFH06DRAFT_1025912 [Mycena polygramma]|nr:hypothetical protein DFH06DRAFT_1025912 [Mycena polygramma]